MMHDCVLKLRTSVSPTQGLWREVVPDVLSIFLFTQGDNLKGNNFTSILLFTVSPARIFDFTGYNVQHNRFAPAGSQRGSRLRFEVAVAEFRLQKMQQRMWSIAVSRSCPLVRDDCETYLPPFVFETACCVASDLCGTRCHKIGCAIYLCDCSTRYGGCCAAYRHRYRGLGLHCGQQGPDRRLRIGSSSCICRSVVCHSIV